MGCDLHFLNHVRLMQVDRARTPWLVVGLHRQMVGPTSDPVNVLNLARLQSDLEELFFQHKVDLVLQGGQCMVAERRCSVEFPGSVCFVFLMRWKL